MKGEVGGDFIITPRCASPLTGSWLLSGTVFPPRPAPEILDYLPPITAGLPPTRSAFGPSGIIRTRSLHYASRLPASCSAGLLAVPSVARAPASLRRQCRLLPRKSADANDWARFANRYRAIPLG